MNLRTDIQFLLKNDKWKVRVSVNCKNGFLCIITASDKILNTNKEFYHNKNVQQIEPDWATEFSSGNFDRN